jgi:hypothetical protein
MVRARIYTSYNLAALCDTSWDFSFGNAGEAFGDPSGGRIG